MTLVQNNQYSAETNIRSEYDRSKPFASFKINYTKKNLLKSLKAQRHIIYTLSPFIIILAILIYIIAFSFYFTRIKSELNSMPVEKIFTVVWCTMMTLMVGAVVAFFVIFEIIRFRKAKAILKQIPHQTEVKIYENHLEYADDWKNVIAIPYSELSSIKETEEYYFVTCKNKQMIILEKSKSEGYYSYITSIAQMYNIYRQNLISKNGQLEKMPAQMLAKIKNQSIRLIPLCIASIYVFIFLASFCLSYISSTTSELKIILKAISTILILLSNVLPIYSIIFGAKYKIRNLNTVKNIVIGSITLFYTFMFSLTICLSLINL